MRSEAKLLRTFLWRRLDQPGHDACRLFRTAEGWHLAGVAVFCEAGRVYDLRYEVSLDSHWRTLAVSVSGHHGVKPVDLNIRPAGDHTWQVGNRSVRMTAECLDVDLGFTPATNLIAIRRLALRVGQQAEAPAAWLNYQNLRVSTLPQTYRRVDKQTYRYEAPTVGYRGSLRVSSIGAVVSYPRLFKLIA